MGQSEEKNGGSIEFDPTEELNAEGTVRMSLKFCVFGSLALMGVGLMLTGCKSKPPLTSADALALIQAEYDNRPAAGATIAVFETGLKQGLTAKYWKLTKVYPNQRWADYTLTDEGKKVLKLANGGDVIEWRPEPGSEPHFAVITVAANHWKARDVQDPQDEIVPGVDTAMGAAFTEMVNLDGVPEPLQDMAHSPRNKLSAKRQADFALVGGAWKLHGID